MVIQIQSSYCMIHCLKYKPWQSFIESIYVRCSNCKSSILAIFPEIKVWNKSNQKRKRYHLRMHRNVSKIILLTWLNFQVQYHIFSLKRFIDFFAFEKLNGSIKLKKATSNIISSFFKIHKRKTISHKNCNLWLKK